MKYKYTGKEPVMIPYVGYFEPNKEYEVETEIVHPNFEQVKNIKSIKK